MPQPRLKILNDSNLQIIFCITLMTVLGVSSISPALPKMALVLNIPVSRIGLVISAFTLPGVILSPLFGVLADRYGRRRIILPSLVLFAAAGAVCVFIRDFKLLLIWRFIQGIGSASLGVLNITMIGDLYQSRERARVMGFNASVLSVGTFLYPIAGGLLAVAGWYYPFLLSLLALPVGWLVFRHLRVPRIKTKQTLTDYLSSAWDVMRRREVLGLFTMSLVIFILIYGTYLTYFPILMTQKFAASPFVIGIYLAVMSLGTILGASQLGTLTEKWSEKIVALAGFFLYAVVTLWVPLVANLWVLLVPAFIFGIANGFTTPCVQVLLIERAPVACRGAVMSINGMILRLGQTLGPLVLGRAFMAWGLDGTFYAGAVLSAGTLVWLKFRIFREENPD